MRKIDSFILQIMPALCRSSISCFLSSTEMASTPNNPVGQDQKIQYLPKIEPPVASQISVTGKRVEFCALPLLVVGLSFAIDYWNSTGDRLSKENPSVLSEIPSVASTALTTIVDNTAINTMMTLPALGAALQVFRTNQQNAIDKAGLFHQKFLDMRFSYEISDFHAA